MEKNKYIVAVDLGSSNVSVAAGSKDPDGKLNILDVVVKPLEGMSAGEVTNIEQVTNMAAGAIAELQNKLGIDVTEAYTGISGREIKCADSSYFVYVSGEDGEISEEDVRKLHESMNNLQAPEGACILDRTPQKYFIDSREETMQPIGRFGHQLDATYNFILAARNGVERLLKTFSRMGIRSRHLYTNAQASAAAVMNEDDKELGVAVIDIGAGTSDICIWHDNIMRYVGVIPVGSNAINHDIRSIAIPDRYIEKLKTTHGYAVANDIPDDKKGQIIKIKGRTARESKEISFYNLAQIIEARMLDIVENALEEIKDSGYADRLGSGIILTGGGAKLNDIETLFREKTKYEVRVAAADHSLINDRSIETASDPALSTVIGLLILGLGDSKIEPSEGLKANTESLNEAPERKEETYEEPVIDEGEEKGRGWRAKRSTKDRTSNTEETKEEDENFFEPEKKKEKKKKKGLGGRIRGIFTDIFEVVDDEEL